MIREKNTYWQNYYDAPTVARSESLRQEFTFESTDVKLLVDAYIQTEAESPVVMLHHGGGTYSRLFLRVALALFDRGYTVLVPNQRGQGLSAGGRGDFTLEQLIQNVLDGAYWAKRNFSGDLFMAGAGLGGSLVFQAAMQGAPVLALACHTLYDFGSPDDALALAGFSGLREFPGGAQVAGWVVRILTAVSPRMRVPVRITRRSHRLLDLRDNGNQERLMDDPFAVQAVSMRYAMSAFNTSPTVPLEENPLPVIVTNPVRDQMINPQITLRNYQRLGGPKDYAEMDYGHWSLTEPFAQEWATLLDAWFQKWGKR